MKLAKWKLSEVKKVKLCEVKGNPNFQGILNWIIETLYYYCRKQHKNIKNSQIIEQNVVLSLWPSFCLLRLALPSPPSTAQFFQFLDRALHEIM